jgi:hypothetical protein
MRIVIRLAFVGLLLLGVLALSVRPVQAAERCFPETGHCIDGRFRQYWEENGGLPVFGLPTTAPNYERNADTRERYTTQWFERNRFEYHFENRPPYDVLLGRLGDDRLRQLGRDWHAAPRDGGPQPGCLWFDQTGRNVCDQGNGLGFKTYWQTHGLEFDGRRGTSYEESLALFGLPLTAPQMETNASGDTVLTQWFERARFEWHHNKPDQFKVLLGLLGAEVRPNPQPLTVVAHGFGQDGIAVGVGFVVENPNQNLALESSQYQIGAYDSAGRVLKTDSGYIERLEPGERVGIADDLYLPDGTIMARLDVQLQMGEILPSAKRTPVMTAANVAYLPDRYFPKVTGTILNSEPRDQSFIRVSALLYDASGQIIGGGYTYVDFVPANGQAAAEVSVDVAGQPARAELWPARTSLSRDS